VVDTYNVGDELEGKVTKVVTFGAFVEILDGVEGLVHISELAEQHVENPREVVNPGDEIKVKVLEIDNERRRLSLSAKQVEGQVLTIREGEVPPPDDVAEADPATLDDVPELGLSEDVFAEEALAEPEAAEPEAEAAEPEATERRPTRTPRRPRPNRRSPLSLPPSSSGAPVPFVGLTGGIGSGKSTALAALQRLGAATLSSDAVVHELYASDELRDAVVDRWGPEVAPGGTVDRAAVAAHAFASPEDRTWLESTLWPRVGVRIAAWREDQLRREPPPRALVVEVPLLFEAGMERFFDATIAVVAAEDLRHARAAVRGHEALDERVARQLPQDEKARRAGHVVVNDGSTEDLERNLSEVLAILAA
jgi:dephospho-CoA kinase